ncbi:zincin-like metallopeptidase domain-containing protein, partial [Micrococcus luteus]|nr:zincin-like metallopeptidase domain-containing protein [Micrococcus luteus]
MLDKHREALLTASGANITNIEGNQAFYRPITDEIILPLKEQFKSSEHYYSTALHELGHWSGHESRLNRDLVMKYGSPDYAR